MIFVIVLIILLAVSHIHFVDAITDWNQQRLDATHSLSSESHLDRILTNNRNEGRRQQKDQHNDELNHVAIQTRIIGGTPVYDAHEFPFYAIPAGQFLCGATMIWEDIALSAAHCASYFTDEGILVGGTTIDGQSNDTRYFSLVKDYIHPEYRNDPEHPHSNSNDIVLLHIVNGNVPPPYVQINTDPTVPSPGTELTVIGFGDTIENVQSASSQLLITSFNTIPYSECLAYYGSPNLVTDTNMVCAGTKEGGRDSCQGDSGGPVMIRNPDTNDYTQVGIVSFGDGCGKPNAPSVNTRVSNYIDWIQNTICTASNNPPSYCQEQQQKQQVQQNNNNKKNAHIKNNSNNDNNDSPESYATIMEVAISSSPVAAPALSPCEILRPSLFPGLSLVEFPGLQPAESQELCTPPCWERTHVMLCSSA